MLLIDPHSPNLPELGYEASTTKLYYESDSKISQSVLETSFKYKIILLQFQFDKINYFMTYATLLNHFKSISLSIKLEYYIQAFQF